MVSVVPLLYSTPLSACGALGHRIYGINGALGDRADCRWKGETIVRMIATYKRHPVPTIRANIRGRCAASFFF